MPDPEPVITPFRVVLFVYTVIGIISALDSVPPEWKTALAVASAIVSAILLVFFGTSTNPSIAQRAINRFRKPAAK